MDHYLTGEEINRHMTPWKNLSQFEGPESSSIPDSISSVKVTWDYYNTMYPLHLHAGVVGFYQTRSNGSIFPPVASMITHDPEVQQDSKASGSKFERPIHVRGAKLYDGYIP